MDSEAATNLVLEQPWGNSRTGQRHHLAEHPQLTDADGGPTATSSSAGSIAGESGPAATD